MKRAIPYVVVAVIGLLASASRGKGVSVFQNGKVHFSVGVFFHLNYSYGHRIDPYGGMAYDSGVVDSMMMEGIDADSTAAGLSVLDSAQRITIIYKPYGVARTLTFALDSTNGVCDLLFIAQSPGYNSNYLYEASFSSLPFHIVNGIFKLLPIPNDSLIAHLSYAQYDYHLFEGMFSTDQHSGHQSTTQKARMQFNDVAVAKVALNLGGEFTIRSTSHSVLFTLPASPKSENLECFDLLGRKVFEQSFPPSSTSRKIERTFSNTAVYVARYANHAQQFFSPR